MFTMLRQRFISVYRSHSDESGACTADDGKVGILWESLLSLRNLHLDSINPIGFQLNGRVYLGFCQISTATRRKLCVLCVFVYNKKKLPFSQRWENDRFVMIPMSKAFEPDGH